RDGAIVAVLEVADLWSPEGTLCAGGELRAVSAPGAASPRTTRALFQERGWSRVAALWTDGVMGRAEEHITKVALEICDGLLVQASAEGALPPELLARYPRDRVVLAIDGPPPRASLDRALLLRALVLKNHGASHMIVERSKAPADVLDEFAPGELGITPLVFD